MNNFEKLKEKIPLYLEGELRGNDKLVFEHQLQQDILLQKEVDLYKKINLAVNEQGIIDLRESIEEVSAGYHGGRSLVRYRSYRFWTYSGVAAAVVLVLTTTFFAFYANPSHEKLFKKFYEPYPVTSTFRSPVSTSEELLLKALEEYDNQEYKNAVEFFEKALVSKGGRKIPSLFYLGLSEIELEEYVQANSSLKKVIKHKENLYVEQAKWYSGLCYLMLDSMDMAKNRFESIAKSKSIYNSKAEKILKKLE